MDRELVKDWIAALRSGEYRQGHGQLRYQPGIEYGEEQYAYCCLGVAADVAINTGKLDARWDGRRYTAPRCLTQSLTLPDGVLPLFGLTGNNQDILIYAVPATPTGVRVFYKVQGTGAPTEITALAP